jgi:RHS repeat-associated protein
VGVCGTGWQTLVDIRLEIDPTDGSVLLLGPQVGPLSFERLPQTQGEAGAELELADGARLVDVGDGWRVTTKEDRVYLFPQALASRLPDGRGVVRLGAIGDRCDNLWRVEWRGTRAVNVYGPCGRTLVLTQQTTPHGPRLEAVTLIDPATRSEHGLVRYTYDADGDLVAVIDGLGAPYQFAYQQHRMVRHTDRNGLSFYYAFEDPAAEKWRVTRAWGDGGLYDYRFEYLDVLNARNITDSLGHVSQVSLDERGLPICEIDPLMGRTIYHYDDCGRTTAVIDPENRTTRYEYDEHGNLLKLTRPDGSAVVTGFDTANKAISFTDPGGATWQQRWDERGLLREQVSPLGHTSRFDYDEHGLLVTAIQPRGAQTRLAYDVYGHPVRLTDALGHSTTFAHDPLGRLLSSTDALGQKTQYRYDAKGRLVEVEQPSGVSITCEHDAEDNLIRYVDERGGVTQLAYYGQGEVARRVQPDGHEVAYLYDTEERLIGVRNQRGELYELRRDALGRIVQEIDYWGQARHYRYSPGGHLLQSTDPLGRSIYYQTDALGRIVCKSLPDPRGHQETWEERFTYNAHGHLVRASNAHGEIEREFDAQGQLAKEVQHHSTGASFTVHNRYDEAGNRIERRTESHDGQRAGPGHTVQWTYDMLGQAATTCVDGGAPKLMQRDALGRLLSTEWAAGLTHHCRYDTEGRLCKQAVTHGQDRLTLTQYDYDAVGNLTLRQDSHYGHDQYVYDPMGRILAHTDPLGYIQPLLNDPAGDRLGAMKIRTEDGQRWGDWRREGRFTDLVDYQFDRAGNLVCRIEGAKRLDLGWDANQRLAVTRRSLAHEDESQDLVTVYGYDPFGRRLFKETSGRRTWFGWDGDALAFDHVPGVVKPISQEDLWRPGPRTTRTPGTEPVAYLPDKVREFVYQPGSFEPALMLVHMPGGTFAATQVLHYLSEPNGCPTRLIDETGKVMWAASHTAWGKVYASALHVNEVNSPIRLQGQYEDGETGLHYNRHRYFEPVAGMFLSQDPLGLVAGENIYALAENGLSWVDPLGLACGPAAKQNRRGQWIDAKGKFARPPHVTSLPSFKGKSRGHIEDILRSRGYTRMNPDNPKNQRWKHPDGSEVQIHAYGNVSTGPYKAGNNAHAHKSLGKHGKQGTIELADDGATAVNTHSAAAHIGIKNPIDFPTIAGRAHGT